MSGVTNSRRIAVEQGIRISQGRIGSLVSVNKFGRAPNGVQLTATDLWDRADSTPTQQIWIAPTQARIHNIVSSNAADSAAGGGARTIKVFGLTSWDTREVSEVVTMNGVTPVPTVNSYVIIHRMQVVTKGATNVNVGTLTATAAVDATITAAIRVGLGQTQMCIYGVPSVQNAYIEVVYASLLRTGGPAVAIDLNFVSNPEPQDELTNFLVKETFSLAKDGSSAFDREFFVPLEVPGPAIIKLQGIATVADTDVFAGFDLILDNKP